MQLMLALREYLGEPVWDETLSVERARALTREEAFLARGTRTVPVGDVEDLTVDGLPARLYTSAEPGEKPLLLYLHGGGFVVGDLDTHDAPCRMLCRHAGVDVLAVEYRKAPEHPFPGYVEDARTAFAGRAERYDRVAVGGDSAGGNLAATIAIEFDPVLALLIYPVVDATEERPSRELFGKRLLPHRRADAVVHGPLPARGRRTRRTRCARRCSPAPGGVRAGAGRHRGLRPAARRGRGLRGGAARGRRAGAWSAASPGCSTASSTPSAPAPLRTTRSSKSQG